MTSRSVAKTYAPFLIVHGTHDEDAAIAEAQELYDKLTAAAGPVSFLKIDEGHRFEKPESRRRLVMETTILTNIRDAALTSARRGNAEVVRGKNVRSG